MATAPKLPTTTPRWARSPFYFNSAAHLLRVGCEKATTLMELLEAIRTCPESTIFQHTFQTLAEHHFISSGFSNDFSHWAFASCNEVELAERLASIDVREFTSIATLRERLIRLLLLSADRCDDRIELTHEALAEMLGVRRASVSSTAGFLRESGGIESGRGRITILDRARLRELVCECYPVIRRAIDSGFRPHVQ